MTRHPRLSRAVSRAHGYWPPSMAGAMLYLFGWPGLDELGPTRWTEFRRRIRPVVRKGIKNRHERRGP